MHAIESLYLRLLNASASHIDLCVHASVDYSHYDSYPTPTFGIFKGMLPQLRSRFAVQASSPGIEAVINEAPSPQSEVNLSMDFTVQIVDSATQLTSVYKYMPSAAFVRHDRALVLWGDDEGAIVSCLEGIVAHIQSRHAAIANSISYGLSGGVASFNNLPPLDELPSLTTAFGPAPTISPEAYAGVSLYPQWQSPSPDLGGLQLALPGVSTPFSDNSVFGFGSGDFDFTYDFSGNSLSPDYFVGGLSEGEDVASDVSVVSSFSDRGASPVPSVSSEDATSTTIEYLVPPPVTVFRRHSVGQMDAPLGRTDSEKTVTKRGMSQDVNVDGDAFNVDVNQNQQVAVPDVRASKRIRPFTTVTVTAASAPALLTVPLPAVDSTHSNATTTATTDDDNDQSSTASTAPPSASASASASVPAPRRPRRRGGGTGTRVKRTPCPYCAKSFSRVQDAQRHVSTSCAASPEKEGVECPECGKVLSRLDAVKRHWRGHENPTCEPPEWALRA